MTDQPRRSRALLPVLFAPVFMVLLDVFIVNVAAPSLQSQLGASESEVQWVIASYLLGYAMTLIIGGRLGDAYGRRRLFAFGVAGFTVASAACAAAPTPLVLIVARLLQGLAAAAMWPQVLSIIQVEMPPDRRVRAFGIQGLVQGLASVTGQIVGGGLIALDLFGLGWRWVFLVNVPIGVAALLAAGRVVPESRAPEAGRLDFKGMGLATVALLLFLLPAVEGREAGWPWWVFVALAVVPLAAWAFVAFERGLSRRGGAPLVDIALFANPTFRRGLMASVCQLSLTSFFLVLSIYLQDGAGLSSIQSALVFTPLAVAFVLGSVGGARITGPLRGAVPPGGSLLCVASLLATAALVSADAHAHVSVALVVAITPFGLGMGLAVPAMLALVLGAVPSEKAGTGSGVVSTSQQIGNALGVSVGATIFFQVLAANRYGHAFAITLCVQAAVALLAAGLFTGARVRAPRGRAAAVNG